MRGGHRSRFVEPASPPIKRVWGMGMTRRAMVLGAIVLAVLVCTASAGFSADPVNGIYEGYPIVKVRLDAQEVAFDVPAILMNGRTLVPVRGIQWVHLLGS